jgi:hypothetical protein
MGLMLGREHHDRIAGEFETQQIAGSELNPAPFLLGPTCDQP